MARVLIIGGGVSGLSAGIYAQLSGHSAVICEKNPTIGGNLTGWQRGDYHIDNCIHWLTGTNPNTNAYKIWCDLGALGDVEIMQCDSLYTCSYNNESISLYKDLKQLKAEMLKISPADSKETLKFIKMIEILQYMCDIGGENHNLGCGASFYFRHLPILLYYHRMSTGDLSKKFKHPLLKQFISCFLGDDFASLALLFVFAHFTGENGGIPRGSSYAMAQRMANRFKELGGEILTSAEVVKINHENRLAKSAICKDGKNIEFDYLVITTDPKTTFEKIIDSPIPKQLNKAYKSKDLIRFSSYQCAFACDSDSLGFSGDLIFEIPEKYRDKLHTKYLIIREYSHEPDFAPKNKNIIQSLTFCNESDSLDFIKLRNNREAYKAIKKELSDTIEEIIVNKLPHLSGKLTCIDVWTPATYKRYMNSDIGSYLSFAMPKKYVPTRMSNRIKGLDNVFLATQWQQAPGGLPIAAIAGKEAIEAVCRKEKIAAKHRLKTPAPVRITN